MPVWYGWRDGGPLRRMGAAAGFVLLLDPSKFGLHSFYRDRIARRTLGRRPSGPLSRRPDRATYAEKATSPDGALRERPLHLVCAAANDLDGDPLGTSRAAHGARPFMPCCR